MSLHDPVRIDITQPSHDVGHVTPTNGDVKTDVESTNFAMPESLLHEFVVVPHKLRLVTLAAFILSKSQVVWRLVIFNIFPHFLLSFVPSLPYSLPPFPLSLSIRPSPYFLPPSLASSPLPALIFPFLLPSLPSPFHLFPSLPHSFPPSPIPPFLLSLSSISPLPPSVPPSSLLSFPLRPLLAPK